MCMQEDKGQVLQQFKDKFDWMRGKVIMQNYFNVDHYCY